MNIGHKYKSDILLDKKLFFFFLYVWCKQELIKGTGKKKIIVNWVMKQILNSSGGPQGSSVRQ